MTPACVCHDEAMRWHRDPRKPSGGYWRCAVVGRAASRVSMRNWRAANPDLKRAQDAAWRDANRERRRAADRLRSATHPEHHRAKAHLRRARKRNAEAERVVHGDVFERDGWVCQLCFDGVDPELAYPHPKSQSLDHVVPLARGGTHTWGNVQLAHLGCNRSKGARTQTAA